VISPSKMKKKILSEIAEQVNNSFGQIFEKDFLSFCFLSDEDPFEAALKGSCRESFPSLEAVVDTRLVDKEFLKLLDESRLLAAVIHLKGRHTLDRLLWAQDEIASVNLRNLARSVWNMNGGNLSSYQWTIVEGDSKHTFIGSADSSSFMPKRRLRASRTDMSAWINLILLVPSN
jgi:hypothetical protein